MTTTAVPGDVRAEIGIIGGSGFYEFLSEPQRVQVATPFGAPSQDLAVGEVSGRRVAFVARHGRDHRFPPHRVNYRANLWALRAVGVRQVLAPCAVGSLRARVGLGSFVVPDQVVDRTWGRKHTFYDSTHGVVHVGFGDPYCPAGREVAVRASRAVGATVVGRGTLVVINGPRFSSRAESLWHQAAGWDVVGMTGMPEAALARELALCYTSIALVTDHDAGVDAGTSVTHRQVLDRFAVTLEDLKRALSIAIAELPPTQDDDDASCPCRRALDGLVLPLDLPR